MIDKMTLSDTTSNHSMLLALRCTITSVAHSLARSHQRTRTHNTQDQSSTTHASSCMHTSPACVHTVALPAVNKARLSHQVVIRRTHAVAASLSGTTKNHLRIRCTQHLSTQTAQNTLYLSAPLLSGAVVSLSSHEHHSEVVHHTHKDSRRTKRCSRVPRCTYTSPPARTTHARAHTIVKSQHGD